MLFCITKFRHNHDTCLNNVTYKIKLMHNTKIVKRAQPYADERETKRISKDNYQR